ncbi:hypothetical protein Lalb_Chr20g0122391 [Lupinus albus]|uniref:Uncharacterized protein n=1 Tax=Lupinus albus TaxID=3870 RepID=A0A6A4NDN8_LUPAL|nr:hypothetical protein Lalb_Chr20g0122391 [Lupinus albus]
MFASSLYVTLPIKLWLHQNSHRRPFHFLFRSIKGQCEVVMRHCIVPQFMGFGEDDKCV